MGATGRALWVGWRQIREMNGEESGWVHVALSQCQNKTVSPALCFSIPISPYVNFSPTAAPRP